MKYKSLPLFSEVLQPQVIEEGSKRVKLHPRTISDLQYLTNKVWDAYKEKDDEQPLKGTITVVDPTGAFADVPVYYLSDAEMQGGVFQLDPSKPRTLYNVLIVINPDEALVPTKNATYQTLYHEIQHLMDLNTTSYLTKKQMDKYGKAGEDDDSTYWGHDFEFRAFTNEFLEGLVNGYKDLKGKYDKEELSDSLNSVLNYFGKNGSADEIFQKVLFDITSESEDSGNYPFSLKVLSLVRKHNPGKWNVFLKMLYNTVQELRNEFEKEEELVETKYKKPRKYGQAYCEKTPCHKMGFSQKASCRPYKNCYKKS
jgi:hypothetical protein